MLACFKICLFFPAFHAFPGLLSFIGLRKGLVIRVLYLTGFLSAGSLAAIDRNPADSNRSDSSQTEDTLVFLYMDSKDFAYRENGRIKGPMAAYLRHISAKAGIPIRWASSYMPQTLLFSKRPNYCAYAVLKTPDREGKILFSAPVGRAQQFVIVGKKNNPQLERYQNFADLLTNKQLKTIAISSTSYGPYIDPLIKKTVPFQPLTPKRLFLMTEQGKIDYFITNLNTAIIRIKDNKQNQILSIYKHYKDLEKTGIYFHIGCTRTTNPKLIEKLNTYILRQPFDYRPSEFAK